MADYYSIMARDTDADDSGSTVVETDRRGELTELSNELRGEVTSFYGGEMDPEGFVRRIRSMKDELERHADAIEAEHMDQAVVKFYPQMWMKVYDNQRAVPDGEPVSFRIPLEDAVDDQGELLSDASYRSDKLAEHENAPEEVREHEGPSYTVVRAV